MQISVHLQYTKNVARANKNREDDPTWRVLPSDRPKGSLKNQWYTRLQLSIQKFTAIVKKTPPSSGQVKNNAEMDLYWKSIRLLYSQQASEGLPKKFYPYMQEYFFLSNRICTWTYWEVWCKEEGMQDQRGEWRYISSSF